MLQLLAKTNTTLLPQTNDRDSQQLSTRKNTHKHTQPNNLACACVQKTNGTGTVRTIALGLDSFGMFVE